MASHATLPSPPVFEGEEYDFWAATMKTFLKAYDLWDIVESSYDESIDDSKTVAQMKQHKEETSKNFKALSFLHSAMLLAIFLRIVAAISAKKAWDTL